MSGLLKNTEIIGLDIGTHSIKIVEIDHKPKGAFLTTYGITDHNISLDGYWDSTVLRSMALTVEKLINQSKFAGIKTVMSVRSKDVYVTTMDFDSINEGADIKAEINRQAPYFLPLPPQEMRLSYDLLPNLTSTGKRRAIINATPDYIIENSRNLLEHLNLDGEAIENCTLSQARSCLAGSTDTVVLVDMGGEHTTLSLVVVGNVRSSTYIKNGTQSISRVIADLLGLGEQSGELFMKDLNLVDLTHLPKPYLDYLQILMDEITIFVDLNIQVGQTPDRIVVTGGGANTPGVMEFFASYKLPVSLAKPLSGLILDPKIIPYITPLQNQLSAAIGLAKRSDLL